MGHQTTEFLLRHGYGVVFAWVFAEQMGIPVPALPLLLAAGASAGRGHLSFSVLLVLATIAAALSDSIWYYVGRRKGSKVLNLLCRVSLEPDSCVRNTQNLFTRRGANSLLIAKFAPVWNTIIDGFGNHDPGRGRYEGMRPRWDVLHPGRQFSEKIAAGDTTPET